MKTLFCSFLLMIALTSAAQNAEYRLTVTDNNGKPIDAATGELLRARDSVLLKTELASAKGELIFNIPRGEYLLRVTAAGWEPFIQPLSSSLNKITLQPLATAMQEVTVTAKKPFLQRLSDRLVVNVDASPIAAGSNILDVLERSPGITLDQNDQISLRGRAGVIIMIDGKPTAMSGNDLANYLRGLPAGAVDRIDIITNPSARYDAAGNSGIIDIRMKKDQRLGANGTMTASYGQGIFPKAGAGATFNYRNKAVNLFGNYNYAYRKNLNHLKINRNFFTNGISRGSDNKDNYAVMPFHSNTVRAGADFFPSKNTIIGFVVNAAFNKFNRLAEIDTDVFDSLGKPKFDFLSIGTNDDRFKNYVGNINFKHTWGKRELTADLDYGEYRSSSLTRTSSYFSNPDGTKRRDDDILDGNQQGTLKLRTAKVDYTHNVAEGLKVEAGAKTSFVSSDNDAKFYDALPTIPVVDEGKTNRFFYEEYNNAAYLNVSKSWKKFDFQLGLRGEHTDVKTRQVKDDIRFNNDYFQLFPSAFFNFKPSEENTIGVSVSRRIDRPNYSQLNPFIFQIDATIYSTGQPLLKPQTTWSYELSYTVKSLYFTLGYSRTLNPQNTVLSKILDVIPTFVIPAGQDSNITVQIPVNLESQDYFGLTATIPVKPATWWNMVNNLNAFYMHFNGNLGGSTLDNGAPAFQVRTNNTFTFKKGWGAELNANLNTGGRNGYMVMDPQWALAVGVQKTILKGAGTVRFNMTDIFWTNLPKATVTYPGSYIENWNARRESRVGTLSFTYRFGNAKVQAARKRTTASEEERQRAGG